MSSYKKNSINYTLTNGRWTNAKIDDVREMRKKGMWTTEDTRDESIVSFMQMKKDDMCITLIHHRGVFNIYNKNEFIPQLAIWKTLGVLVKDFNVMELTINSKPAFLLIAQPKSVYDDDAEQEVTMSPLALCYGMMVSGFAYIFTKRADVEFVIKFMESK